jgi:hypothetical protein
MCRHLFVLSFLWFVSHNSTKDCNARYQLVSNLVKRVNAIADGYFDSNQDTAPTAIAKHTKVDMIWVAGRSPTLVSQNLKATTLTYLAIKG